MKRQGLAALTLVLAACASTPIEDRYYSLVLDAADDGTAAPRTDDPTTVALREVELPAFLDTRSLTMQVGANRIETARHHFWAAPLDEAIGKVLVLDIAEQDNTLRVERSEDMVAKPDCALSVEFDRFHASDDARVLVSGRYWLASDKTSTRREFDVSQPLEANGYGHAVSVMRGSLARLGEQIRADIEGATECEKAQAPKELD